MLVFLNGVWLTAAAPGSPIVTLYVLKFGLFMANVRGMAFPFLWLNLPNLTGSAPLLWTSWSITVLCVLSALVK
jgi:hypothetical protein